MVGSWTNLVESPVGEVPNAASVGRGAFGHSKAGTVEDSSFTAWTTTGVATTGVATTVSIRAWDLFDND